MIRCLMGAVAIGFCATVYFKTTSPVSSEVPPSMLANVAGGACYILTSYNCPLTNPQQCSTGNQGCTSDGESCAGIEEWQPLSNTYYRAIDITGILPTPGKTSYNVVAGVKIGRAHV